MYSQQFILYRQHILIFNPLPIYPTIVQPITTLSITIKPLSNNIKNQLKTPNTRLDSLHFQKTIQPLNQFAQFESMKSHSTPSRRLFPRVQRAIPLESPSPLSPLPAADFSPQVSPA